MFQPCFWLKPLLQAAGGGGGNKLEGDTLHLEPSLSPFQLLHSAAPVLAESMQGGPGGCPFPELLLFLVKWPGRDSSPRTLPAQVISKKAAVELEEEVQYALMVEGDGVSCTRLREWQNLRVSSG